MIKLTPNVFQDGAEFYHEQRGLIARYPGLVKSDRDINGAELARLQFAKDYPHYVAKPGHKAEVQRRKSAYVAWRRSVDGG